jgi:hypothetical protein
MGVGMIINISNSLIIVFSAKKDVLKQKYFDKTAQPPITLQPLKILFKWSSSRL